MSASVAWVRRDTQIGVLQVEATTSGLHRVHLPGDRSGAGSEAGDGSAASTAEAAMSQIEEYTRGQRESFEIELDWDGVEPTHRRVLEVLCEIAPYGTTVTYGELGRAAGVDDPREVGVFMARNHVPLVVPCHRVIAADGLGGYGGGLELKQRLLELEGVLPSRLELGL